jgi:hypothetical protein
MMGASPTFPCLFMSTHIRILWIISNSSFHLRQNIRLSLTLKGRISTPSNIRLLQKRKDAMKIVTCNKKGNIFVYSMLYIVKELDITVRWYNFCRFWVGNMLSLAFLYGEILI